MLRRGRAATVVRAAGGVRCGGEHEPMKRGSADMTVGSVAGRLGRGRVSSASTAGPGLLHHR